MLGSLVTAAQQEHDLSSRLRVVHAIAGANISPQLSHAVPTELVITEISLLDAADSLHDLRLGDRIA